MWSQDEIYVLFPILERIGDDIAPLEGKQILVLCSASGEVAFWLAQRMEQGKIIGLELDPELLKASQSAAKARGLERIIEFRAAEKERIPFPDSVFDVLLSEFILYPTPAPTEIGQPEMARVLKSGGTMVLTDVITPQPYPNEVREALAEIGLTYLCEATKEDFRDWMEEAGLTDVQVTDITPVVREAWEYRRKQDLKGQDKPGYRYLLEDDDYALGRALFYIYVIGRR